MSWNPADVADEVMSADKKKQSWNAEELADTVLEGHQAAASQVLEADFEPGVYAPAGLRWTLARGDNMEEKRLRLKKKYPDGELDTLKQSIVMGFEDDMLIWRESPQSRWKAVEPQGFDRFDIIEAIAPSAESIAAETAVAIGTSGGSIPITVARQALGAFAGEAFEQGVQSVTDVQGQSAAEILWQPTEESLWSAAGGFAMSPFAAVYNAAKGAGALRVGEEGSEIIEAANRLNQEDIGSKLTPGLVTDNPAIRLSEAQSSALLPKLRRRYRDLISSVDRAVRTAAPGNSANAAEAVVVSLNDLSDEFLRRLPVTGTRASEGGRAIKESIETYSRESQNAVSALYNNARAIQEPEFDLKPVYDLVSDLRRGAKGTYDESLDDSIKELQAIDGAITLSDGSVLSVTDQIRNVRTGLSDKAYVEPGERFTQKHGQANDIKKAIDDALANPTNTDPAFVNAWKAASDAAKKRFNTLEKAPIMAAAKSEAPSNLVRTYLRPGNYENLLAIRDVVGDAKWREFVDAGYSELLRDPTNLSKNLKAFDQETLDVFMPRRDQELFRTVAKEIDRLKIDNVNEIAERQMNNRNIIDKIITTADPRMVDNLEKATRGGREALNRRKNVRAAIIDWAWDGIVEKGKNTLKINHKALKGRIKKLKENGLWQFLAPEERRIIGDAEVVARAFQSVQDAGTSIMAASTVQSVQRLEAGGIYTALRLGIIGQFYTSEFGRMALIGSGKKHSRAALLRAVGGALAQTARPEDISDLVEDE